jgi:Sec-independent protein secretion pathway component TatC
VTSVAKLCRLKYTVIFQLILSSFLGFIVAPPVWVYQRIKRLRTFLHSKVSALIVRIEV